MNIAGISGFTGISSIRPMNYAIKNESQVSDVYNQDSVVKSNAVDSVTPVVYPNAQSTNKVSTPQMDATKTLEAAKEYNSVANKFTGMNTGYSSAGMSFAYGTEGSGFDAYA